MVVGVIAGGLDALTRSMEGAEDVAADGAAAMTKLALGANDFVVGIAASGTTPYVRGALERAMELGARTAILVVLHAARGSREARDRRDRAAHRPGGDHGLDAAQGRHRHEAGAQHDLHRRHGAHWEDVREPDGGSAADERASSWIAASAS